MASVFGRGFDSRQLHKKKSESESESGNFRSFFTKLTHTLTLTEILFIVHLLSQRTLFLVPKEGVVLMDFLPGLIRVCIS